ncbi:hypothetical protein Pmani_011361 [Petrolisthes manimaculis]|uniref:Uncharacterized protein n=1 Tax=Petrolisthes manimaculis TaxID=1843537 RepID=A0AAE1Q2K3_9EUCA|nr:hypothetical protein Pmani_011361 [Petrolisthes manimaculis]
MVLIYVSLSMSCPSAAIVALTHPFLTLPLPHILPSPLPHTFLYHFLILSFTTSSSFLHLCITTSLHPFFTPSLHLCHTPFTPSSHPPYISAPLPSPLLHTLPTPLPHSLPTPLPHSLHPFLTLSLPPCHTLSLTSSRPKLRRMPELWVREVRGQLG